MATLQNAATMLLITHYVLLGLYAFLPAAGVALAIIRWRKRRDREPLNNLAGTAISSLLLGAVLATIFAIATASRVRAGQIALAAWYFAALLIVLKLLDRALRRAIDRIVTANENSGKPRLRKTLSVSLRIFLLAVIALPLIMSAVMTFRPKVRLAGDPLKEFNWPFEEVYFSTRDGNAISGWWIPAANVVPASAAEDERRWWGRRTAVVVHGLGANKLNQLMMGAPLRQRGFNILAIDLRAHGHSTGQFTSFGAQEWQDVAAGVRWARIMQPRQSERVVGVAASLGAAAMLISTTDSHPDRRIDAIGVYATYATLPDLARDVANKNFPPPLNYLTRYVALPLACVHAGANLYAVSPIDAVRKMNDTPLMIVHGRRDQIIDVSNGQKLHDAHPGPKKLILLDADHNAIIEDFLTADAMASFLSRHAM
jgi:fermentation-respiration switch protein FrsA (DUF1100 family)